MDQSFNKAVYYLFSLLFLVFIFQTQLNAQSTTHASSNIVLQKKFTEFSKHFVEGYKALNMPEMELSYVTGLQHIKSADSIKRQLDFFRSVKAQLPGYKTKELTPSQQQDRELIAYETGLNLQRLALEQEWIKNPPAKISKESIYTVPNG